MEQIDKEKIISEIRNLDFKTPIASLFATVRNPYYDMESYSKELDNSHMNWDYSNNNGPLFWQEYDEFDNCCEEPEEHKAWRINHNKKFETMKVTICVTPKKICDGTYKIDEKLLNGIVDELDSYIVYSVSKN